MKLRFAAILAAIVAYGLPIGTWATELRTPKQTTTFNWMANGVEKISDEERRARTKAALTRAKALAKGATWVCSPAGFGKASRCHRG